MRIRFFLCIFTTAVAAAALPGEHQSKVHIPTAGFAPISAESSKEVAVIDPFAGSVSIMVPQQPHGANATSSAETLEIQITRTKRHLFFTRSSTERHIVSLSTEPIAGRFAFDEAYILDQAKGSQVSNNPGIPPKYWHDFSVMRTGGQLFISREEGTLRYSLFYRRVDGVSTRESDQAHHYTETRISDQISQDPKRPTVLTNVTPEISKIVITHRSH